MRAGNHARNSPSISAHRRELDDRCRIMKFAIAPKCHAAISYRGGKTIIMMSRGEATGIIVAIRTDEHSRQYRSHSEPSSSRRALPTSSRNGFQLTSSNQRRQARRRACASLSYYRVLYFNKTMRPMTCSTIRLATSKQLHIGVAYTPKCGAVPFNS